MHISETVLTSMKFPKVLLILGTDASGKNHVTNFIADVMHRAGIQVEKRDGWFSKPAEEIESSEDKGPLALLKERLFLATFPLFRPVMPFLLAGLIRRDLKRFHKPENGSVIVISHTALRVLAFYLGHQFIQRQDIRVPAILDQALRAIQPATGARTIVLDIDDAIRKQRIEKRRSKGKMDNFDRYMASDSARSERIEDFLVWIATTYLDARILENNDLDDPALFREIARIFS